MTVNFLVFWFESPTQSLLIQWEFLAFFSTFIFFSFITHRMVTSSHGCFHFPASLCHLYNIQRDTLTLLCNLRFSSKEVPEKFSECFRTLSRWLCVIHTVNYFTFLIVPSFSTKRIVRIILQTLSFNSIVITLMVDKLQNVQGKSLWWVLNIIQEYFQVSWKTLVEFAKLFNNCPKTCKYWLTAFVW